jgi:hypothetical protein
MSTITLSLEDESLAEFQRLAEARGTTAEALLAQHVRAMTQKKPSRRKSLEQAVADARARLAAIPPAERNVSSPQLQALIGILPPDIDVKKEYREHLERKYL